MDIPPLHQLFLFRGLYKNIIAAYLILDFLRNVRKTNIFEGSRFLPRTTPLIIKIAQSAQH